MKSGTYPAPPVARPAPAPCRGGGRCLPSPDQHRSSVRSSIMGHDHQHHTDWKHDGVQVIPGDQLDPTTAGKTAGMNRATALHPPRNDAPQIWRSEERRVGKECVITFKTR